MHSEYFLVLLATCAFPLARMRDRNLDLIRHRRPLVSAVLIVCVVFWIWDVLAAWRGHWSFNPEHVIGMFFLGLPVEEWLFFLILGYVSIFVWESVKFFMSEKR